MYGMGFCDDGSGNCGSGTVGLWEEYVGTLPFHRIMHHATDSRICPYLVSCFFSKKNCVHKSAGHVFTLSSWIAL